MLALRNTYEGEPMRIYRRPADIRRDIDGIKAKIKEADDMLNVRSLLLDVLSEVAEGDPDKWIPEIEEIVEEAKETLSKLSSLERTLCELQEELKQTGWVMGLYGNA